MAMSWLSTFALALSSILQYPSRTTARHIFIGVLIGFSFSLTSTSFALYYQNKKKEREIPEFTARPIEIRSDEIVKGVVGLIGNTPLVRINSLSDALGVEILGKAEFLNIGGSVKDRVALQMINDAEKHGYIRPNTGSRIFEGTVGSTGISIATIARARGYDTTIIMPDDVAAEKVLALQALGAEVERVRPSSIVDKKQYVNLAKDRAASFGKKGAIKINGHILKDDRPEIFHSPSDTVVVTMPHDHPESINPIVIDDQMAMNEPRGFFADQFEALINSLWTFDATSNAIAINPLQNTSNFQAHYTGTGPEIWRQTNGHIDAFVAGAGTGGTVAGVGHYLKSMSRDVLVAIADPEGSGLYNKVKHGVMFDRKESEGTKRRHQVDTVVEGIGNNRMTHNIDLAMVIMDDAFRITDAEAVAMSRFLVKNDGLFLGSSSACNLMACVKLVKAKGWTKGDNKKVVTILCDSGSRHYSKTILLSSLNSTLTYLFRNDDYLQKAEIPIDIKIVDDLLAM